MSTQGDDMTTDEFAKTAYALLAEGLALLRAHAGEGDVINRYCATVETVRAQYRAAKEAPAPAPTNKCKGGRGKCGAPAEDLKGPPLWGHELDGLWFCSQECRTAHIEATTIPAPAPEPSAPPTGVPVCPRGFDWCGVAPCDNARCEELHDHRCQNCRTANRPLNQPPSDPVTVMIDGTPIEVPDGDECPGCDDHCEDEKCPAAHGPCVDEPVATGGLPAGFRLGDGWVVDRTYLCSCTGCRQNTSTEYYKPRSCGKGACAAHAVRMGALVPIDTARSARATTATCSAIADDGTRCERPANHDDPYWHQAGEYGWHSYPDTARSVPPGPVPVGAADAPRANWVNDVLDQATRTAKALPPWMRRPEFQTPPAAPAGDPAVRPLSERMRPGTAPPSVVARWRDNVVALEAELDARTAQVDSVRVTLTDERDAARAEVEQLRGRLADEHKRRGAIDDAEATARVRSMREACAAAVRGWGTIYSGTEQLVQDIANEVEALPLDTGTATDTGGAVPTYDDLSRKISELGLLLAKYEKTHAAAIKAAVDKANNRAADAFSEWHRDILERTALGRMNVDQFEAWLRSGEDVPGAVGK